MGQHQKQDTFLRTVLRHHSKALFSVGKNTKMRTLNYLAFSAAILVMFVPTISDFMTDFKSNWTFVCPQGKALQTIESSWERNQADRLWHLDCDSLEDLPLTQCDWEGYQSSFGHFDNFKCGGDRVIAGVASNYSTRWDHIVDRKFQYYCCGLGQGNVIHACEFTSPLNAINKPMGYTLPSATLISGITSTYDSRNRDRTYKLDVCKLSQIISAVGRK